VLNEIVQSVAGRKLPNAIDLRDFGNESSITELIKCWEDFIRSPQERVQQRMPLDLPKVIDARVGKLTVEDERKRLNTDLTALKSELSLFHLDET
jgi:hypothetical protein